MTDHKNNVYLIEAHKVKSWTLYASKSFGAVFVFGSLILMMV